MLKNSVMKSRYRVFCQYMILCASLDNLMCAHRDYVFLREASVGGHCISEKSSQKETN